MVVSRYSVIQYVPDPIADERMNVGVIVFNDDTVRVHFVSNWERARRFGMENIEFLKNFAHSMEEEANKGLLFPGDDFDGVPYHERVLKISREWINSIQFTEPRAALDTIDGLLEDSIKIYLHEQKLEPAPKFKVRDRKAAARIVRSQTREALKQKFGNKTKELIKQDYPVKGNSTNNKFDVVVANTEPYFAAHGISFEVDIPDTLKDAVLWRISDVKSYQPYFPIAILVLPPKLEQSNYKQIEYAYNKTLNTYKELGADIIQENDIESWVLQHISKLIV